MIAYVFTGNFTISFGIGVFEFFSKVFAYYAFEKIWNKLTSLLASRHYSQECYKLGKKSGIAILISGLNCSGKTTLAKELVKSIPNCILLDGDAMRQSINYDLGFSDNDIHTNLTKISNLTNVLIDQGFNVIISCISKKKNDREFMKERLNASKYIEVHTFCDEEILRKRQEAIHPDAKVIQTGYEKSDYEVIEVDTGKNDASKSAKEVLSCLTLKD